MKNTIVDSILGAATREEAAQIINRIVEERDSYRSALESFCLAADLATGIKPDADVQERIGQTHGSALAVAWRKARELLK